MAADITPAYRQQGRGSRAVIIQEQQLLELQHDHSRLRHAPWWVSPRERLSVRCMTKRFWPARSSKGGQPPSFQSARVSLDEQLQLSSRQVAAVGTASSY
ncbi:hypothetical protein LIA77_07893 [Sarocladium implicatum]|nr:hypothetical protein LIA77_07893 [Sarocladium implicatum]